MRQAWRRRGTRLLSAAAAGATLVIAPGCSDAPTGPALGGRAVRAISVATDHTCALAASGLAYCWGDGWRGQLGDGFSAASTIPVAVAGGRRYTSIGAGTVPFSCAVATEGTAYCWGPGAPGGSFAMPAPTPSTVAFATLAVSYNTTCGLDAHGRAYCWGDNYAGMLGNDSPPSSASPVSVSGGHVFGVLSSGGSHTCGVTEDGVTYCWGSNFYGQLGVDTTVAPDHSSTPVAVSGGLSFRAISAGWYHTCGIARDGAAYCWGENSYGQLGADSGAALLLTATPVPVAGGLTFTAIASGTDHTCAIATGGAAYCWGDNGSGQLGTGDTATAWTPTPVRGGLAFTAISAGQRHTCAVTPDGYAFCWGDNAFGKLGDGTTTRRLEPTQVSLFP